MKYCKRIKRYKEGMKINPPCAIADMPIEVYHASEGLSNSGLKTLLRTPATYYYKYLSGEYKQKEKPYFKIGKAAHCYVLEGARAFKKRYWHNPYGNLLKEDILKILSDKGLNLKGVTTKVGLMDILLETMGIEKKEIELTDSELNQVVSIARSIKNDDLSRGAFSQKGRSEISLFWRDEETGVMLKCRPDWLPKDHKDIPDYKTCETVEPEKFYDAVFKYGYHIQSAMYQEGIRNVFGDEVKHFFFVGQEKEPPFISQVFLLDPAHILYGEKAMRLGIRKYIECMEKGIWETYSNRVIYLSIAPKPDDLPTNYDRENSVCYAPAYLDKMLARYEL